MEKLMKNILIVTVCCLMTMTMANADKTSCITVEPVETLEIDIGSVGTFTVTLNTDSYDNGTMEYDTGNDYLLAQLINNSVSTTYNRTGSIDFDMPEGSDEISFTLNVKPISGITCHTPYDVDVSFLNINGKVKAMATASTVPIPELSTIALMSAGLLGLLGLVRLQRKE